MSKPTPPVGGPYDISEFYGDKGGPCYEIVVNNNALLDNEGPVSGRTLANIAGLLNAASQVLYDLDKEKAANNGRYPERLSDGIATSIDILLRAALNAWQ